MSVRTRLAALVVATLSVSTTRTDDRVGPLSKDDAPTIDPNLRRREVGAPVPFGGGYGWGTSGPVVAGRYMVPEHKWERDQIAAHAKSERRRLTRDRNDARRLAGRTP